MNFLQRTPFFRLVTALIAGILSYRYIQLTYIELSSLFLSALILLLITLFIKNPTSKFNFRWIFGLAIILIVLSTGQLLCKINDYSNRFDLQNKQGTFIVEVKSPVVERKKSFSCEIELKQQLVHSEFVNVHGNAIVYFAKTNDIQKLLIGDEIVINTTFQQPQGAENPDSFNYAEYLCLNGIRATAYIEKNHWYKTAKTPDFSILRLSNTLRTKLIEIYRNYKIENQEFAVLSALTVGYTDELSPELRSSYSGSGAMHILSVSGLHVGIIYAVIAFLFGLFPKNKTQTIISTVFIVLFLWTYAFITGLSPSVIRAAAMFSFVAIGTAINRKSHIYNTIFATAFFILILNPNFIYNIGFQLSYSAVLSIILFHKPISNLIPVKNKALKWLRDLFVVSISAQLGTLAFTLYYFQQFPNYFLLTNLMAIPLSTFIIYTAIGLISVSGLPIIAGFIAEVLSFLLQILNYCIDSIHKLPFSVSIVALSFTQMLLLIASIALFTFFFQTKNGKYIFSGLICILTILIISLFNLIQTKTTDKIIVYSSNKNTHINFIANGKNYIISSDSSDLINISKNYWQKNFIERPTKINKNTDWEFNNYLIFANKSVTIAEAKHWKLKNASQALSTDILIIGNHLKPKTKNLFENIHPKLVIVDKTISDWYTENLRQFCNENKIEFYSIKEKGAYMYQKQNNTAYENALKNWHFFAIFASK